MSKNVAFVDVDWLGSGMRSLCDSIREKTGVEGGLAFPGGMQRAIEGLTLSNGGIVKVDYGSEKYTSGDRLVVTHNLGACPDFIFVASRGGTGLSNTALAAYGFSPNYENAGFALLIGSADNIYNWPHGPITENNGIWIRNANDTTFELASEYGGFMNLLIPGTEYSYLAISGLAQSDKEGGALL